MHSSYLSVLEFHSRPVRYVDLMGTVMFASKDICDILEIPLSHIEFLPFLIPYAEVMTLCSQYPFLKFGLFIRDIMLDNCTKDEWKFRHCESFLSFTDSYFSNQADFEQELSQQAFFKDDFLSGKIQLLASYKKIVKATNSQPDFIFESENGEKAIGEMKMTPFTPGKMKQVLNYLEAENLEKAYVIAPELRTILPDNITFIKWEKKKYGKHL